MNWPEPSKLEVVRCWFVACALLRLHVSFEDFKGAYLVAPLHGPPVFLFLPDEIVAAKGRSGRFRRPVARASKAVYGQQRAGHDYDAFARDIISKLGWRSLREFDSEEGLYFRDC